MQNTTEKTKDRATQTPLKTGGELRCSGIWKHMSVQILTMNISKIKTVF